MPSETEQFARDRRAARLALETLARDGYRMAGITRTVNGYADVDAITRPSRADAMSLFIDGHTWDVYVTRSYLLWLTADAERPSRHLVRVSFVLDESSVPPVVRLSSSLPTE